MYLYNIALLENIQLCLEIIMQAWGEKNAGNPKLDTKRRRSQK